ncbi:MAG: SpoIIE family protein phosphatase [Pirellulaceae bacterium]|nr:SpoIIE family protein phosphatase [Pirellulaceae bacterium]
MNRARVRILLVEDDRDDVWIMRNLLAHRWDVPVELVHAETLAVAMRHCAMGRIDLILLDLSLPDSRGLETFLVMYSAAEGVPIVVLTGDTNETLGVRAVQAGAEDYLVKNQVDDQLLIRSIRYALERKRRHRIEDQLRDTSEEFRGAQQIQKRLFPATPPRIDGLDIASGLYPAKATAGDYFDYIPMSDGRLAVVIGDVTGHGMGPALLMAETRACLRTLVEVSQDPSEILTRANRVLARDTDGSRFVTLMLLAIDSRDRSLQYASAGQRGYLLDETGEAIVLDSTSLPLGVAAETVVPRADTLPLKSGQIVALFTDGLVEAESPGHQRLGVHRVLDAIHSLRRKPAQEIVEGLHQMAIDFCGGGAKADDITIVLVKAE